MGMSAYAELIVGAQVQRSDLFDERVEWPKRCQSCEESAARGNKFCGECGLRLEAKTVLRWKTLVFEVLRTTQRRLSLEDTERGYWDRPIFSTDEDEIFVGKQLSHVSCSYDKGATAVTFDKVERARADVGALLVEMGLGGHEISLVQLTKIH